MLTATITRKAEVAYLFTLLDGCRASDPALFRRLRRAYRVLKEIDLANNAVLCEVEYESEDVPQTVIRFRGTYFAANGVGKFSKQTVIHAGGDHFAIYLSDRPGRYCGLEGYTLPLY